MTRDDIIRMAREADISVFFMGAALSGAVDRLEQFAALVAAAEREACAKVCDAHWMAASFDVATAKICAAAIRERGDT